MNLILEEMIFDTIKCNDTYYLKICIFAIFNHKCRHYFHVVYFCVGKGQRWLDECIF